VRLKFRSPCRRWPAGRNFDALIALGAVVRGETYHFEIVANESASGIMTVQLDTDIPVANGILTTEDNAQALARMSEKGRRLRGSCGRDGELAQKARSEMKRTRASPVCKA